MTGKLNGKGISLRRIFKGIMRSLNIGGYSYDQEKARRVRQIEKGQLTASNGLSFSH